LASLPIATSATSPGGAAFTQVSCAQDYVDGALPPGTGNTTASKALVIEYFFASFPTTNAFGAIADSTGGANPLHGSADLVIQTVRAGVNFKF
jgi:hypothetical protein